METAFLFGAAGLGAYLVTRNTRDRLEAMSSTTQLAYDTKPSIMSNMRLQDADARTEDRGVFLERVNMYTQQIPDAARSIPKVPQFYSFPRKETTSVQVPEVTSVAQPQFERAYERERLATTSLNTFKDYKDSKGQIWDSGSTGVTVAERETPIESIVNRTPLNKIWDNEPHVVRVNDDTNVRFNQRDALGRSTVVNVHYIPPQFGPRPKETLRRVINEESTRLLPTISNDVMQATMRPATVDMGRDKDRSLQRTHIAVTPNITDNYPRVRSLHCAEYARKNELSGETINRPTITAQWDGPLTWNKSLLPGSRSKYETYANTAVTCRPGVQGNRGWRQFAIDSQYRRLGDADINTRMSAVDKQETPFNGYIKPTLQSRKPGDRLEGVTSYTAAYGGDKAMLRYTEPPSRGLAPDATLPNATESN